MKGSGHKVSQGTAPNYAVHSDKSRFETSDYRVAAAHGLERLAQGQRIVLWLEDEIALEFSPAHGYYLIRWELKTCLQRELSHIATLWNQKVHSRVPL